MLVAMPLLATAQLYVPDTSWTPAFPVEGHTYSGVAVLRGRVYVTQRGNISLNPVYVLSTNGTLLSSFGSEAIGTKTTSGGTTTWGAHGIAVDGITGQAVRIYINDFDAFTLTAFDLHSPDFALHGSLRVGTPGVQGAPRPSSSLDTSRIRPSRGPQPPGLPLASMSLTAMVAPQIASSPSR